MSWNNSDEQGLRKKASNTTVKTFCKKKINPVLRCVITKYPYFNKSNVFSVIEIPFFRIFCVSVNFGNFG